MAADMVADWYELRHPFHLALTEPHALDWTLLSFRCQWSEFFSVTMLDGLNEGKLNHDSMKYDWRKLWIRSTWFSRRLRSSLSYNSMYSAPNSPLSLKQLLWTCYFVVSFIFYSISTLNGLPLGRFDYALLNEMESFGHFLPEIQSTILFNITN